MTDQERMARLALFIEALLPVAYRDLDERLAYATPDEKEQVRAALTRVVSEFGDVLQYEPGKVPKELRPLLKLLRCERSPRTVLVYAVAYLLRHVPEVSLFGSTFRRPA